jgi:hypothetical protein
MQLVIDPNQCMTTSHFMFLRAYLSVATPLNNSINRSSRNRTISRLQNKGTEQDIYGRYELSAGGALSAQV